MAPYPLRAPARAVGRPRIVGLGGLAALMVVSGCSTLSARRLDFDTTESAAVTRVVVLPGSGDVTVRGAGPAGQVRIKRVVRYRGSEPATRYEIDGGELTLNTDCGDRCSVSYDVTLPSGAAVNGEVGSGNVQLSLVGAVDFRLSSGNITVTGATGAVRTETSSGDVAVDDVRGPATLRTGSGNITGRGLGGQLDAQSGSGDVAVELAVPAAARAHAGSGNVALIVPAGRYRVRSSVGSGDADLGVIDDPGASLLLDIAAGSGNVTVIAR